jgi:hypothetical protein
MAAEDPPITALVVTIAAWHVADIGPPHTVDGPVPFRVAGSGSVSTYLDWLVLVVPYTPGVTPPFYLDVTGDGANANHESACIVWEHGWNGDPDTPLTVQAAGSTGTTCPWPAYPTGPLWYSPAQFVAAVPTGLGATSHQAQFAQETPVPGGAADAHAYARNGIGSSDLTVGQVTGECSNLSWLPEFTTTKTGMGDTTYPGNPADWFPSAVQWLTLAWGWDYTPPAGAE